MAIKSVAVLPAPAWVAAMPPVPKKAKNATMARTLNQLPPSPWCSPPWSPWPMSWLTSPSCPAPKSDITSCRRSSVAPPIAAAR
jgi:hypothetical protein